MRAFRRRLASFALALTALQLALLFAAPVSACCTRTATARAHATVDDGDCCPAGSHAPGQCPLHKDQKSPRQRAADSCRMMCDAAHGPQVIFAAIGVLPSPALHAIPFVSSALRPRDSERTLSSAPLPDAPPPRLL